VRPVDSNPARGSPRSDRRAASGTLLIWFESGPAHHHFLRLGCAAGVVRKSATRSVVMRRERSSLEPHRSAHKTRWKKPDANVVRVRCPRERPQGAIEGLEVTRQGRREAPSRTVFQRTASRRRRSADASSQWLPLYRAAPNGRTTGGHTPGPTCSSSNRVLGIARPDHRERLGTGERRP